MAVTDFKLCEARHSIPGDDVQFCSHEVAIGGVDSIAGAGPNVRGHGGSATRHAGDVIKIIVSVGEPEAMTFNSDAQAWDGLELKNASEVLDILQREEIHVAVKLVIGGEQVFKSLVLSVCRIAIAG